MLNNILLTKSKIILFAQLPKCMSTATATATRPNQYEYNQKLKKLSDENEKNITPEGWDTALPYEAIPGPKPLPIIGNFWRFAPPFGELSKIPMKDLWQRLHEKYGKIFVLSGIGKPPMVSLSEAEDMETVYRNDGPWPVREGVPSYVYYRTVLRKDRYGDEPGIGASQGETWSKLRTKLNPIMMQPRVVAAKVPDINETCQDFIRNINILRKNDNGIMPDNFVVELQKWTLESMGVLVLDTRLGCLEPNLPPDAPAYDAIKRVNTYFNLLFELDIRPSLWPYISTPNWRRYVKILDELDSENMKYIDNALERLNNEPVSKPENKRSTLERLVKLDPKVAVITAVDLMIGGVDTTSTSLTSLLYEVAVNPEKQAKIREEAKKNLPNKDSPVTDEILENSPYTRASVKEALRLYPPATVNLRTTQRDLVLAGYQVPKGTSIILQHMMASKDEKNFKKTLEFIPERWLRTNKGELSHQNAHPFAFMPFGHGPRTCIGRRMVVMELEIALIKMARNFIISWPHKEEAHIDQRLFYGIAGPLKLKFDPVNDEQ